MTGLELANSLPIWIFATAIIVGVIYQAVKFLQLSKKAAKEEGLTDREIKAAMKTGAITSIGPSVGIIIVAVSLISLIGNPLTMMRIGIIGSAPIELTGAEISARTAGVELGSTGFTPEVFTLVAWTLCIGGTGGMIFTLFFTRSLEKIKNKVFERKNGEYLMTIIASAAMIAMFGSLTGAEMLKGYLHIVAAVAAIIASIVISYLSKKTEKVWIKEWSLGISIVVSLTVVYFLV